METNMVIVPMPDFISLHYISLNADLAGSKGML